MSIITTLILIIGFLLGLLFIPLLGFVVGASLPVFISEPLANMLFTVACMGTGPARLHQAEDDTYELLPRGDVEGEPRKWTRWALTRFGYTYENTPSAWEHLYADPDLWELPTLDHEVDAPFTIAQSNIERGGIESYVNSEADGLRIRLGAALNRLKGSGLLTMASETLSEGFKEYGGDTSDVGMKWQAGGTALFLMVGVVMGWRIFF